jgi:hypothetical protein
LLLAKTQLSQGHEHLTASPSFPSVATRLLLDLLNADQDAGAGVSTPDARIIRLRAVHRLWSVVAYVFTRDWTAYAADELLAGVLAHSADLASPAVLEAWSELCSDLIVSGSVGLERVVQMEAGGAGELGVREVLWTAVAKAWVAKEAVLWTDALGLLVTGIKSAPLSLGFPRLI